MLNLTYLSPNPFLPPGISVEIRCHLKAESLESCSDLSFPAYESSLLPPPVFTTASLNLLNYQEPFNWFYLVMTRPLSPLTTKVQSYQRFTPTSLWTIRVRGPAAILTSSCFFLKPLHCSYWNSLDDGLGDPSLQPQCSGYWGKRIMSLRPGWTVSTNLARAAYKKQTRTKSIQTTPPPNPKPFICVSCSFSYAPPFAWLTLILPFRCFLH